MDLTGYLAPNYEDFRVSSLAHRKNFFMSLEAALSLSESVAKKILKDRQAVASNAAAVEISAQTMISGFFDKLLSIAAVDSDTFSPLITKGFNENQIWQQVQSLNDSLGSTIKKQVKKVVKSAETEEEPETAAPTEEEAPTVSEQDEIDDEDDDEHDDEYDDDELEDDDDVDDVEGSDPLGEDGELPSDWEAEGEEDDDDEKLSDSEGALAAAEYALEFSQDDEEEEEEVVIGAKKSRKEKAKQLTPEVAETVSGLRSRLRLLEDEIDTYEQSAVQDKHWSLIGEASAKTRPFNSLLDADIDLPFGHMRGVTKTDDNDPSTAAETTSSLEKLIKQRCASQNFDDVIKRDKRAVLEVPAINTNQFENLDFEKARTGLGDVYAKQYSSEILGNPNDEDNRISKDKLECRELFAKVMHKLDCLTNSSFKPRPPLVARRPDGALADLPAMKLEETVPVSIVNNSSMGAPQDGLKRQRVFAREELQRDDRQALRRAEKSRRRSKINKELNDGKIELKDLEKRKLGKKGHEQPKNKQHDKENPKVKRTKLNA